MTSFGLYVLTEEYMEKHYIAKYPQDKETGERPFFFAINEESSNLYWVIPISSKVKKYKPVIEKFPNSGVIHELYGGKESVILTQNIVPAKIEHFEREFTVNTIHYILKDEKIKHEILTKAKTIIALIKHREIPFFKEVKDLYNSFIR
jgi:carotenoid cleavage dioxygenase-like enzyme